LAGYPKMAAISRKSEGAPASQAPAKAKAAEGAPQAK
jgi:hypothetical protein